MINFTCNICGAQNAVPQRLKHRELLNCSSCGSNARFRGIIYCLQNEFYGRPVIPLNKRPQLKDVHGIGMSDSEVYARILKDLFTYENTFYHQEPLLDVKRSEQAARYTNLDFVISSDVLEHVEAPISQALRNIHSMLKTSGILILSVPYVEGYETIEHFPHLNKYKICNVGDKYVLINQRLDGDIEEFRNLVFHGGPGAVLEHRVFGEGDLLSLIRHAGFGSVDIVEPNVDNIGFLWDPVVESPLWKGRRGKSYILVCRTAPGPAR
jgi:SAM-dependent methyltransferase